MRLTQQEKETIINFNQGEGTAYIYTCSKAWINHMENKLHLKPIRIHSYAREYECPKTWIRKPQKPRKLSKEQKLKLKHRFLQTSILSEETPYAVGELGGINVR